MLEPSMYSPELTWDSDDNFNSNFDTPEQVYYPVQYIVSNSDYLKIFILVILIGLSVD